VSNVSVITETPKREAKGPSWTINAWGGGGGKNRERYCYYNQDYVYCCHLLMHVYAAIYTFHFSLLLLCITYPIIVTEFYITMCMDTVACPVSVLL
jgi:hypothetical protein